MPRIYHDGFDDEYDDFPVSCQHGNYPDHCEQCEDLLSDAEKCLNCGRIKAASSLNKDQVCEKGCVNPNEY